MEHCFFLFGFTITFGFSHDEFVMSESNEEGESIESKSNHQSNHERRLTGSIQHSS
jgi:hypothetical protein